jgi:hypothetical protein
VASWPLRRVAQLWTGLFAPSIRAELGYDITLAILITGVVATVVSAVAVLTELL